MNRVKVLVFTLLVVGGGAFVLRLHAGRLRNEALLGLDARLLADSARVNAALRSTLNEAAAVAALSARDPALRAALEARPQAPPPPRGRSRSAPAPSAADPAADAAASQAAADAALTAAKTLLNAELPRATIVAVSEATLALRPVGGEPDALVREAVSGTDRVSFVRSEGKVWAAAAMPAGTRAGVAVLVPLGESWVRANTPGSGVEVTLAGNELKAVGTARAADMAALTAAATRTPGTNVDVGSLSPVDVFKWSAVQIPKLSPLFGSMPAFRARAIPVEGLKNAWAVVSISTSAALAPIVSLQWQGLFGLSGVFLLGLLFALLVAPSEIVPAVPEELVAAAAKIESGDFETRAPRLVGKLGIIAAALNRAASAASAARPASQASSLQQESSATQEFFATKLPPLKQEPEPEPPTFDFPARPPRTRPLEAPTPSPRSSLNGDPFQAAAVAPAAGPAAPPEPALASSPPPAPVAPPPAVTTPPPFAKAEPVSERPVAAATPAPAERPPSAPSEPSAISSASPTMTTAPVVGADEVKHWQQVFEDFLRTRGECGEATEGLTFDRFRTKLESNRTTLIAKYGCKTVRFQVYVKEGRAALKATPIR